MKLTKAQYESLRALFAKNDYAIDFTSDEVDAPLFSQALREGFLGIDAIVEQYYWKGVR